MIAAFDAYAFWTIVWSIVAPLAVVGLYRWLWGRPRGWDRHIAPWFSTLPPDAPRPPSDDDDQDDP